MTSTRHLRLASGAGEVDPCLALRMDIHVAAQAWYDCISTPIVSWSPTEADQLLALARAEERLRTAVKRYRAACKERTK